MLKKWIKEWYALNKTQRRGTLVLLFLFFFAILFKLYYKPSIDKDIVYFANIQLSNEVAKSSEVKQHFQDSLFFFNPNTISESELRMLGLHENIISNILKFRNAGGKFFSKESLKKIYGMNDSVYQILEPYILIENQTLKPAQSFSHSPSFKLTKIPAVELNAADTSLLEQLNGIGKVLSVRIIKFRNRLGGFYSIEQLKEVYGISDSLYNYIVQKNKITLDTQLIQKINLNTSDFKTMIKHPYFNKEIVVAILNIQKKKERVTTNMLHQIMDENTLKKLQHYIEY